MKTFDLVCQAARQMHFLRLQIALGMGTAAIAMGQQGYQVQGQHPPAATSMPRAYAQQSFAPPPGAGTQGYPQQQQYQPQPYQSQYQPQYQPQQQSGYAPSPYATNQPVAQQPYRPSKPSARQQAPAQQSLMPSGYPAYGQQPMPYPQYGSSQGLSPLNGTPRTTKKTSTPTADSSLSSQVASLKNNDRLQDKRLADLERHTYPTAGGSDRVGGYGQHQVVLGDSLSTIASRYGSSVDEIKRLNRRSTNIVMTGEVLTVPVRSTRGSYQPLRPSGGSNPATPKPSQSGTHIVQRGESLSEIAAAYRVSLRSLQDANAIRNANLITPGQRLKVPGGRTSIASTTKPRVTTKQYVSSPPKPVKTKETVVYADIPAAGTGTGQVIAPSGPRGVTSYRVDHGDTIESVARSFSSTPSEIQRINKLSAAKLPDVGEEIVVPLPGSVSL